MADGVKDLATYKRMLTEALTLTEAARKDSQIDQDYYDGYQWTPEERRSLTARKQPDLVFNRVRPAINGTLGVIQQGETDPRAYPRNPKDADAADVASKSLRYIADKNRFDDMKLQGAKDYLVAGTCAAVVEYADDEIKVELIRHEEFFYDPRARKLDLTDARYMGVAKWMYADDVAEAYPEAKQALETEIGVGEAVPLDDSMQDRPKDGEIAWVDSKKRRLMVVEMYHKEGGWQRCVFFSGGVLAKAESPYQDDKGRPCNPIEAQSCYIDRENNRYGLVRDMRGPQDEINKRRSKLLHLVSVRQVQESEYGALAGADVELVRKEAARPDGVLPSGVQVVPTSDMASGQASLLAEAKAEIERMGPNPAMLGRQGADSSGRAQMVRQQAGLTELAIIFGGVEDWELRLYRQMWNRARQFWQAPMWIRVTDDDGVADFIGLNQPKGFPVTGPDGQPVMDESGKPQMGPPVLDQMGQPLLGLENEIAKLDIDIILDSVPNTANLQQEQFAMLVELAKSGVDLQSPMGQVLFEASSLPNKRELMDKIKGQNTDPQAQQAQAEQAGIAKRGAEAKVAGMEADAALTGAKAQNEMLDGMLKQSALMPPPGFSGDPLLA